MFLVRVGKVLSFIETGFVAVAGFVVMIMMFFATAEIGGRYLFNKPIRGHLEMMEIFLVLMIYFGVSYTQRVGGHIGVDFIIERISGRTRKIIEAVVCLLSVAIVAFLVKYSYDQFLLSLSVKDATDYIHFPFWSAKMALFGGLLLLGLRLIIQSIQSLNGSLAVGKMR